MNFQTKNANCILSTMKIKKYLFTTYSLLMLRCVYVQNQRDQVELHLGSKTPYRVIENRNIEKINARGKPMKIWMLIRHGSRFPSRQHLNKINLRILTIKEEILKNSSKCVGCLSKDELKLFRKWQVFFDPENESKLSLEGEKEMQNLARRMHTRFPTVLTTKYNPEVYEFNYTKSERTLESAKHFAVGLFGEGKITRPDNNKEWLFDVKEDSSSVTERKRFKQSYYAKAAVEKINKKFSLDGIISFDDLDLLFKTCGIESACNRNEVSPWCILFDEETLKIMEFAEDLKHYWLVGLGCNLTCKQAYPIFKHMIDFFENKASNPKVVLNFTHSSTLLKLLAFLHLYRDEKPLSHEDFGKHPVRKWQLSKIGGFGSNITFVLYLYNNAKKILVLHQERVVRLPCCPQNDFCDLDVVKKFYNECCFEKKL